MTVDSATAGGTDPDGSDYAAASGTLVFAPGVTTLSVQVPVIGDDGRAGRDVLRQSLGRDPRFAGRQPGCGDPLLFDTTLESNDWIECTVTAGRAIVYGSAVDNTTQDPSLMIARPR